MVVQQPNEGSSEQVLEKYKPWGSFQTKHGYGALHVAMRSIAPVHEVKILIDNQPISALSSQDNDGATPLHVGMEFYGYNAKTIETVVSAWPEAASMKDKKGRLPLHLGMEHKASLGATISVLGAFPDAAQSLDDQGRTPIYIGMRYGASDDSLKTILDRCPSAVRIGYRDWTLLHWSMSFDISARIVQILLTQYLDAALIRDADGRTPLHVGMAMGANTESLKLLRRSCTEAAEVRDLDGWIPLQYGIRNKAPDAAIEAVRLFSPDLPRADGRIKKPYEH